jgi:hypothetical protein
MIELILLNIAVARASNKRMVGSGTRTILVPNRIATFSKMQREMLREKFGNWSAVALLDYRAYNGCEGYIM